jgi:hypothetical protein
VNGLILAPSDYLIVPMSQLKAERS